MRRHQWKKTETFYANGGAVTRCPHCKTERIRDTSTKGLYLYRGEVKTPHGIQLDPVKWSAFVAGVVPPCVERVPRGAACEGCDTKAGVSCVTDPYDQDVNGIDRKTYLCAPCYNARVDEI